MSEEYEQEVSQENGRPLLKNRYAVDRELGRGGMSVVYLAHDRKLLNKPVVVKVLLEKQTQNEWVRKKFMQEMEALARIDHPGIINVLDYGDLPNGTQYLVMQYIEGKTLRDSIPQGGMEMSRASNLIRQVGQALAAAHDKGVWHRDLKPENIMISTLAGGEEHVKLIDFGIAGIKDSVFAGSKTNVAGSLTYMAPEQFAGKPSAASDLYAFAIVAYEMLSGEVPFPEDSLTHLASAEQSHVMPLRSRRPEIPEAVDGVMQRALSFQPEARQRSVKEFAAELTAALYPQIVAEPAPAPVVTPAPAAPSRRWLVGGLGLAAVLAGSRRVVVDGQAQYRRHGGNRPAPGLGLFNAHPAQPRGGGLRRRDPGHRRDAGGARPQDRARVFPGPRRPPLRAQRGRRCSQRTADLGGVASHGHGHARDRRRGDRPRAARKLVPV
ncbi:MAG: serine/threonine protein kinase [Bryobacterales bacterium]|nr:serine/threonine protein kinase [Bryobacterales bacterium]